MRENFEVYKPLNTVKTIRANDDFELMYLVRKAEKEGWKRGRFETNPIAVRTKICYMTKTFDRDKQS